MTATLTGPQAAAQLGMGVRDVRELAGIGILQSRRTPGGQLRFDPDYIAEIVARDAGQPELDLKPCGTPAAARRHTRQREDVCAPCQRANRVRYATAEARRKGWATTGGAATIFDVHERTIIRACTDGALSAILTLGGHRRITWESIAAQLDQPAVVSAL